MKTANERTLDVWMNGERVGEWTQSARQGHSFRYVQSWLDSPDSRPISISIPLAPPSAPIAEPTVESFFDNLLPDNADIRRRLQRRFACPSSSAFDLLGEIGRDCVGALQLLPKDSAPPSVREIHAEPLDEAEIATVLREATADAIPGVTADESFRISIAGAQEKTALIRNEGKWCRPVGATPTTHIFKLPLGRIGAMQADMSASIDNEWLCLKLLEAFGMEVARADLAAFEECRVLIVERFDRRLASDGSWWMRLPQEDLCQATGTPSGMKYENEGGPGIAPLMKLLLASRKAQEDRRKFFKAQILFWLLGAPDGHAKNFSIHLERQGRYSLTPLYDVMSVYPVLGRGAGKIAPEKLRMAMAVSGKNRHYEWAKIQGRHWRETAEQCGAGTIADEIIPEILDLLPAAIETVSSNLPKHFPEELAETIFKGIRDASAWLR